MTGALGELPRATKRNPGAIVGKRAALTTAYIFRGFLSANEDELLPWMGEIGGALVNFRGRVRLARVPAVHLRRPFGRPDRLHT